MWKRWAVTVAAMSQLMACCVARGTRVRTPKGLRAVESLAVGDEVTVIDPQTRALDVGKVSGIRARPRECARLWTRLGPLTLTTDHPLFDPTCAEWAPAGDWVLGLRSTLLVVDDEAVREGLVTRAERFVGVEEVFDLTIDHPHHDFVAEGVLVHNKTPPYRPCLFADGSVLTSDSSCFCPDGRVGVPECVNRVAVCGSCEPAPAHFASSWSNDAGDVADLGQWQSSCDSVNDALTVVPGTPLLWTKTRNVLRLRQLTDGGCGLLERRALVEADRSHHGRLYFRSDAEGGLQQVVRFGTASAPWFSVLGREDVDGGQRLVFQPLHDGGVAWSTPASVPRAQWLRYEWHLAFSTPGRFQLWPRLFDLQNGLVFDARDWASEDGTTLQTWYLDGNVFTVPDAGPLDLSLGVEPAAATGDLSCAYVGISLEDWLGP